MHNTLKLIALITFIIMQPLLAMERRVNVNNSNAEQVALNNALKHAVYTDSTNNDMTKQIISLLKQGADINCSDEVNSSVLRHAKRAITCDILLSYGANMHPMLVKYPNTNVTELYRTGNNIKLGALLCLPVYAPDTCTIENSKKIVLKMLCALRRNNVPKVLFKMILAQLPHHHVGNLMIARKLKGLPIPSEFIQATEYALHDSTIRQFKQIVNDNPFISQQMDKEKLKRYEKCLLNNVKRRLKKAQGDLPLRCNGVTEQEETSKQFFCRIYQDLTNCTIL